MNVILQNWWLLFIACLLVCVLTGLWMQSVAKRFYISARQFRFGFFDLEFPASEYSLDTMVSLMNTPERAVVHKHLLIDFLFMPAVYVGVALLCIKTADKMLYLGKYVFWGLAFAQAFAWLFDVLENVYLLGKLRLTGSVQSNPEKNSPAYKSFQLLVKTKFGLALTGAVCSASGLLYFWIMGRYQKESLPYIGLVFALLFIYVLLGKKARKKQVPVIAE